MRLPWTQLSASPHIVHVRWKSFLDHVDQAAPRAPRRWTTARPRKGTTLSWGRRGSGFTRGEEYEGSLVRLRCHRRRITGGVGEWRDGLASGGSSRGDEASVIAQPTTGGKITRWFGWLEQENQRLKKQGDRWMLTIQRSMVIESFVD